jgi:hypothetical protein
LFSPLHLPLVFRQKGPSPELILQPWKCKEALDRCEYAIRHQQDEIARLRAELERRDEELTQLLAWITGDSDALHVGGRGQVAVLSVITGGGKWVEITIHADPLYQHLIVTTERKFWRCAARAENQKDDLNGGQGQAAQQSLSGHRKKGAYLRGQSLSPKHRRVCPALSRPSS